MVEGRAEPPSVLVSSLVVILVGDSELLVAGKGEGEDVGAELDSGQGHDDESELDDIALDVEELIDERVWLEV